MPKACRYSFGKPKSSEKFGSITKLNIALSRAPTASNKKILLLLKFSIETILPYIFSFVYPNLKLTLNLSWKKSTAYIYIGGEGGIGTKIICHLIAILTNIDI